MSFYPTTSEILAIRRDQVRRELQRFAEEDPVGFRAMGLRIKPAASERVGWSVVPESLVIEIEREERES